MVVKKKLKQQEVKAPPPNDECSIGCVVILSILAAIAGSVLTWYLHTNWDPEEDTCYRSSNSSNYLAYVSSVSDWDLIGNEVDYRVVNAEYNIIEDKTRSAEKFNELYSKKIDCAVYYNSVNIIKIKERLDK